MAASVAAAGGSHGPFRHWQLGWGVAHTALSRCRLPTLHVRGLRGRPARPPRRRDRHRAPCAAAGRRWRSRCRPLPGRQPPRQRATHCRGHTRRSRRPLPLPPPRVPLPPAAATTMGGGMRWPTRQAVATAAVAADPVADAAADADADGSIACQRENRSLRLTSRVRRPCRRRCRRGLVARQARCMCRRADALTERRQGDRDGGCSFGREERKKASVAPGRCRGRTMAAAQRR
mmetsp:Transcript_38073/g.112769  ORF Transcript_38073/g.112769 Transcript_38073/m.112769 type:complete len:233 (+) Transcript_38073:814-1512(+)